MLVKDDRHPKVRSIICQSLQVSLSLSPIYTSREREIRPLSYFMFPTIDAVYHPYLHSLASPQYQVQHTPDFSQHTGVKRSNKGRNTRRISLETRGHHGKTSTPSTSNSPPDSPLGLQSESHHSESSSHQSLDSSLLLEKILNEKKLVSLSYCLLLIVNIALSSAACCYK